MCDESVLEKLKKTIADKENLVTSTIEHDTDSKNAVGFAGVISHFKIKGISDDGTQKSIRFILKKAPTEKLIRNSMPVSKMYEAEIYAYTKVLPAFRAFNHSSDDFIKIPICYSTGLDEGKEYLILEDLKCEGYRHFNSSKIMNDRHILLILEACAKLHSKSLTMKAKQPELWKELVGGINFVSNYFFGKTGYCNSLIDYAKLLDNIFDPNSEKQIVEKFAKFRDDELKKFMAETCCGFDPDFVLAHGDLWSNNILFKYEDNLDSDNPTGLSFIDWQALRISSIAVDLSYFFYMCASKEAMDNVESYLKYYYDRLSEKLQAHELNPESVFPVDSFYKQWRKYNKFGLTMCLVVLHGVTCEVEEIPSYDEVVKNDLDLWDALNFISKNQHIYHSRVKDVIVHFVEKNYL